MLVFLFSMSLSSPRAASGGWEQQGHVPQPCSCPPPGVTAAALGVPWVIEGHACLQAALCKGKGLVLGIPV